MRKRIAIACGGTGGHINPALAVAEELRDRGAELSLIVSGIREADRRAAAAWEGPVLRSGAKPMRHLFANLLAIARCHRFLRRQRSEVLFATGGYTSFPPVVAARMLGIPVVLHEANSLVGQAVRFLAKRFSIETVALSYPGSEAQLSGVKTAFTGLPLRRSILADLEKAAGVGHPKDRFTLFVTGGSQGAHGMNMLLAPVLLSFAKTCPDVRIIHQCGTADEAALRELYALVAEQVDLRPFVESMGTCYGQADLVIARAGAATCAEIARCGVPTIFIPLPTATDDHQTRNAEALVRCGGALCFAQLRTRPEQIAEAIAQFYADGAIRASMRAAFETLETPDAAAAVADLLTGDKA